MNRSQNLMNEQETAAYLAISAATLRRWRWVGRGPRFIKIGAAIRYDPTDLEAFLIAGRRRSTSEQATAEIGRHD